MQVEHKVENEVEIDREIILKNHLSSYKLSHTINSDLARELKDVYQIIDIKHEDEVVNSDLDISTNVKAFAINMIKKQSLVLLSLAVGSYFLLRYIDI